MFWPRSIFFECGQIFLNMLKYANSWGKISLLTVVKNFDHVRKILKMAKKFKHGRNIFEVADGLGMS